MPNHDVPQKLIEAWLEFHRSKLCQNIDAVFVFNKKGVEIWCLSEEEKYLRRLRRLFETLQTVYKIDFYVTRPLVRKDSDEESAPPPSLSENYKLWEYLRDPAVRLRDLLEGDDFNKDVTPPDEILKRDLLSYAEHILAWSARMKQSALDLPDLVQTALDSRQHAHVNVQASAVCIAHAKDLMENLRKLSKNLAHAFPKSRQEETIVGIESVEIKSLPVAGYSEYIADQAKELSRCINKFIYPDQYTVDLSDLRRPRILDLLKKLESMVRDFQKELTNLQAAKRSR